MSETRHYFIHCDHPKCTEYVMGDRYEPPSRIRRKLKTRGWTTALPYRDYCPTHAAAHREDTTK